MRDATPAHGPAGAPLGARPCGVPLMGDKTAIEWTEATWNPITGCSKVSPGCAHCYAETLALGRLAGKPGYPGLPWTPENAEQNVILRPDRLDQPLRWRRPRMVFVNSMSDLFHELVPDEFIAQVFAVMQWCSQHTFQVLTKRPERMQALMSSVEFWNGPAKNAWFGLLVARGEKPLSHWPLPLPLSNVWLGTSIENRHYVHRADLLRETPAAVRFISAEPLLGPLIAPYWDTTGEPPSRRALWSDGYEGPQLDLTGIDWLIAGGESGPEHRPIRVEWARDLRDACLDAQDRTERCSNPGPAFFFKQHGGRTSKAGGRLLDGREWSEMPERAIGVAA